MPDRGRPDKSGKTPAAATSLFTAPYASNNDAIVGWDLGGIITSWNQAAERLFGFTAEEMIGRPIVTIMPAERRREAALFQTEVRQGGILADFETERLTKDGRIIPVSLTISPVHAPVGEIVGFSKIVRDISEMQRLKQELERREALLRSILDTVPDGLVVIDHQGIVQSFNPAAERMFGYAAAEIVGQNVGLLMPGQEASVHDGYIQRYLSTGEHRIIGIGRIVVARRKDGSTFPMELQIGEVKIPGALLFTGFVRDLTERQDQDRRLAELQSELIHVSRLSELGQMVSALAHEVNQPLTAISNYISGIRRLLPADSPPALRPAIEKIGEQNDRARQIVQGLRGLVKKDTRARQVENLETMIQETSALALVGTGRFVTLDLRISRDARFATVEKVQIQQVLLNLMRNAVEAMRDSSNRKLTVATARRGDRIEIQVSDTGPGIPDTVMERLFQPFVTTKADGLGVGLSICQTIVDAHGGRLEAVGGAGTGAVFRFTVPGPANGETRAKTAAASD